MSDLSAEDVRSLDQMRLRLLSLRNALAKMQENIAVAQPLPSVAQLQASTNLITRYLREVAEQMAYHDALFTSTAVFPLPQFPGKYQGHILTDTLLRTKLEPATLEWVEQGGILADRKQEGGLSEEDRDALWDWAPPRGNAAARKQVFGGDYTRAEVEAGITKITTGLKRHLTVPDLEDGNELHQIEEGDDEGGDEEEYTDEDEEDVVVEDIDAPQRRPRRRIVSATEPETKLDPSAAYLESLQEFMTVGKFGQFDRKAVDERKRQEDVRRGGGGR